MYIFPTGFYSNSLFSALRKSREFAGGKMSSSGSALDLSPLSPHGKFSSLQFLLCGETKTISQTHFADHSICLVKLWDGYATIDKKVISII